MITIQEQTTQKIPGETSLFISFKYDADLIDIIKSCPTYNYNKDTKIWEVPCTSLCYLLERFGFKDEVTLQLLPTQDCCQDKKYELQTYKTTPYDYQLEGIQYGLNHDRWLLLDVPGLGKTLQMLYLAQELKQRQGLEHCLIICGINTLKFNWKNEILKHSDLSCKILGERTNKKGKVFIGSVKDRLDDLKNPIEEFFVITNVETLRDDSIMKELTKGKCNKFDMIVVDEVHKCKSPTSQQGKHLLKLTSAKYRVALTGTLLLNNPLDAYVPLKWIGVERSTYTNFKYYYCNYTGQFHNILIGYRNLDVLKGQIDKYSLRRTKDLLNLPPKTVINEYVDMNDRQLSFYNNIKQGIIDEVDKVEMTPANILGMVTRLRQATALPSILTTEDICSSKVERACDLAEQIIENGSKVVIFSTFKQTLNPIMEALAKYNPVLCTGDIKDSVIENNKDIFQTQDSCKVFCGTWQKCGTGLTLTAANYMIFLDTPWTSGEYTQNQDRIHRIGTDKSVFIYNLICKDTVDERVLELVEDKEALADYVIDNLITKKGLTSLRKYVEELANN